MLAELQKGARAGAGFRLVYVDAGDLHTHPHLAKVWQRRGCPLNVPAAGKNQRRAIFGAVDSATGQVIWHREERKGGEAFAAFLEQLAGTWPDDQLVPVRDNVRHHRSLVVRTWSAAQDGRVTPFWLPVSTPNLKLMERVWWFLKQKLTCH